MSAHRSFENGHALELCYSTFHFNLTSEISVFIFVIIMFIDIPCYRVYHDTILKRYNFIEYVMTSTASKGMSLETFKT